MARYKCPCCGQPYNGKRCRSCNYENFAEEIAHGNHAHEGEPLVIRQPVPRQKSRPTIRRESDCKPYAGKKKKKNSPLKWVVVAVVVLISLVSEFIESVDVEHFTNLIPEHIVSLPVESAVPVPEALEDGLVLYDDGQVLVVADWEQGREFENPIALWMRNDSGMELSAMAESIYVNGYRMEYASFYCQAESGEIARGELWLDEEELQHCGIAGVQQILLDVLLVDRENYDLYGEAGIKAMECAAPLGFEQPIDDSGQVLYDREGVRVIFREIVGSACEDAWLELYIENSTAHVLDINFASVSVNDIQAEVYLFCRLEPGTRAVTSAALWNLPDIGLDAVAQIEELELTLELVRDDDWDALETTGSLKVELR